jgi:hypothetical protein
MLDKVYERHQRDEICVTGVMSVREEPATMYIIPIEKGQALYIFPMEKVRLHEPDRAME